MQTDVEFIKQQIAQEAIEQKNIEKFGTKDPLHPDKLGMINYVFTQRDAREFDGLVKSLKNAKSRQNENNKIYKQMKRKNIDNNISRNSTKTINAQKAEEKGV